MFRELDLQWMPCPRIHLLNPAKIKDVLPGLRLPLREDYKRSHIQSICE